MTDDELIDSLIPQHLRVVLELHGYTVRVDETFVTRNVIIGRGDLPFAWRFESDDAWWLDDPVSSGSWAELGRVIEALTGARP